MRKIKPFVLISLVIMLLMVGGCTAESYPEHRNMVRAVIDAVNRGDIDTAISYFSPQFNEDSTASLRAFLECFDKITIRETGISTGQNGEYMEVIARVEVTVKESLRDENLGNIPYVHELYFFFGEEDGQLVINGFDWGFDASGEQ